VATSGSTLFRQVGGSIGVSIFGAIFANQLVQHLDKVFPPGAEAPTSGDPESVRQLPLVLRAEYVEAFAASLRPVFVAAAGISFGAFLLTWALKEIPLRKSAGAEGVAESFAMPREAESLPELQRIVATLARRENHWRVYQRIAERADVDLGPGELWLLSRLGEGVELDLADPRLAAAHASLRERGLVENAHLDDDGEALYARIVEARRQGLEELLEGWEPEKHDEVRAMLDGLARSLVHEIPETAPR
jgi:hypothetical protein